MNKVLIQCTIASALGGLLFGYDTVIINGAMLDLVKYFHLTPAIQGWTVSSALVGCILGTILIGKPGDIFGSQRLLAASCSIVSGLRNWMRSCSDNQYLHSVQVYRWSCNWRSFGALSGLYFRNISLRSTGDCLPPLFSWQ